MNADEYVAAMRRLQPKLFKAKKLSISPEALEEALRRAFSSGFTSGAESARNEKSLFEAVFGK